MNRRIRCHDISGAQIGDFEEIGTDDWRGVDYQRTAGICTYTWSMLISRLADLIGGGEVFSIDGSLASLSPLSPAHIQIDRSRNTWIGADYLDPSRYLLLLVPKTDYRRGRG
jgi:hypothetical protein